MSVFKTIYETIPIFISVLNIAIISIYNIGSSYSNQI